MAKQKDYVDGLYSDDGTAEAIPTDSRGTLRVLACRAPCKTSAGLEARAKADQDYSKRLADAGFDEVTFEEEEPPVELTDDERAAFTEDELRILEGDQS